MDIDYPGNDIPKGVDNTSAYSHNEMPIGVEKTSSLYVFTWDHFRAPKYSASRIKFHQKGIVSQIQINAFLESQNFSHWPSGIYLLKLHAMAQGTIEDIQLIKH